jgi:uncharacterized phage-associated protein
MATALEAAQYFLAAQDQNEKDITNLTLQKLCAYAQAMSLTLLGRPLFEEPLEAWRLGPVIPSVYQEFSKYGNRVIPDRGLSETFAREPFDDQQKFILEITANHYGGFSASRLSGRLHAEFPAQFGSKKIIPQDKIFAAFEDNPYVVKMKQLGEECARGEGRVAEKEVFDALDV